MGIHYNSTICTIVILTKIIWICGKLFLFLPKEYKLDMERYIKEIGKISVGVFERPDKEGKVQCLQVKHFDEGRRFAGMKDLELVTTSRQLLEEGEVLFAAKGDKNFAVVYWSDMGPSVASPSFLVIRIEDSAVLPEYLAWYLNHPEVLQEVRILATGSNIKSISKKALECFKVRIPSLGCQREIVGLNNLFCREYEVEKELWFRKLAYRNAYLMDVIKEKKDV